MLKTLKNALRFALLLCVCLALTGADYLGQKRIERSRNLMNSTFTITIFSGDASLDRNSYLVDKAFEIIEDVSNKMASQNEQSVVWKINHSAIGQAVPLDDDTLFVIRECLRISGISEGHFDITDEPLRQLWAAAKAKSEPPSPAAIQAVLPTVGHENIVLNTDSKTLTLKTKDTRINIDEPAQGYAADKALLYLKNQGVASAMVKTGDSIRWIGLAQESRYWRFGIDHPRKVDEYAARLELETERAISGTGDYEDFFMYKGKRYPLVIDPKTGSPPANKVAGVTVIAENAAFASLLSRLFFVLGPEKSYEFIDRYKEEGIEAVFIEEAPGGSLVLSSSEGLHNNLKDMDL